MRGLCDLSLELFNTMSGAVETLTPAAGGVLRMYACGPTVYDYGHIGNFRTFLHVDVLRRYLKESGITVRHVMNVTDVDDKIIRNAAAAGVPIGQYTRKFEDAFFEDMAALGVETPEVLPRATDNIEEMVALIERLAAQDIAYRGEDGSWYFRIARFPEYGKLSKKDFEGIEDGARVDLDEYEKDAARDFALWKAVKPGEHAWETRIGTGRPGWHIECSAMATKYLGESFDLHAGGEDLMFPHHENEIAQSESACGCTFARHWMHVRFLLVEGRKMSKSEGNFYTLRDLLLKGLPRVGDPVPAAERAVPAPAELHLRRADGVDPCGGAAADVCGAHACGRLCRGARRGAGGGDGEGAGRLRRRVEPRPEYGGGARGHLRPGARGELGRGCGDAEGG